MNDWLPKSVLCLKSYMILAVLVFIKKVTHTTTVSEVTEECVREGHVQILQHKVIPAYAGLQALESLADQVHESERELILCGVREQPSRLIHQAEFQQHIGPENKCNSIAETLNRARAVHPETSKHHPMGTIWGRRSMDVLEPEPKSGAPEPSAIFKEIA
jgi:MFS superfamily sulfate permease-like transporter